MSDRKIPEINAGSMADIAFLLLVFFLVTTTIQTDAGILVTLPPYVEDPTDITIKVNERNVYDILVNSQDQVLAREMPVADIYTIKDKIKEFIMNPTNHAGYAESPKKAVVSLRNDNGTSYDTYIQVYNTIMAAYNELWEESAQNKYSQSYESLTKELQKAVRSEIPLVISEAEPTNIGG